MTSIVRKNLYPSAQLLQRLARTRRYAQEHELSASSRSYTRSATQHLAHVKDDTLTGPVFFTGSAPVNDHVVCNEEKKVPDARTLKLGKTIEVLHERLPTLLASPLPQDILSPQITLHLFPSTHPHLPKVTGKIAYLAALWTAPVAWGRVPVIGNVKIVVESEQMVKNGALCNFRQEKLVVRWKTCGKAGVGMAGFSKGLGGSGEQVDKITAFLKNDEEFAGLFIFEFDEEGRIVSHTIEHAQEGSNWEKMTRFVSVTDWLIGLAKGRKRHGLPEYALCGNVRSRRQRQEDRAA